MDKRQNAFVFSIAVLLSGCADPSTPSIDAAETAKEQQARQFAFVSTRSGNHDVYLMSVDGDSAKNLTNHPATDFGISWSPDGEQLLFGTDRDGNREIYLMDADGGNAKNLTNHPGIDAAPAWSPDGSRIAFISDRDGSSREIYVMNADGSNVERLTDNERYDEAPAWSADGTQLAFGAVAESADPGEESLQVFVIDIHTREETQLTRMSGHNSAPRWSPDGSRIAFYGQVGEGFAGADIFTMDGDGTNLVNLTNDGDPDWQPDWSDDGEWIIFSRGPGDPLNIWMMRSDGTERSLLVGAEGRDEQPEWRPSR